MTLLAICLGLCASVGMTSSASPQHSHHGGDDSEFAAKAAGGNMAEVALGRLGVERALSADVKQFAQRMIDDHTQALDELRNLASQKSLALPDAAGKSQQSAENELSKFSGRVFDREFMEVMIKNHNDALDLFQHEAARGDDPEMKQWAARTVDAIKEHLRMAREIGASVGVKK
jgi:putative membrane protein